MDKTQKLAALWMQERKAQAKLDQAWDAYHKANERLAVCSKRREAANARLNRIKNQIRELRNDQSRASD